MQIIQVEGKPALSVGTDTRGQWVSIKQQLDDLQEQIRTFERKAKKLKELIILLQTLPESWRNRDPGKYGESYWFLDNEGRWIVVHELLAQDVKIFSGTYKEWNKHLLDINFPYWQTFEEVPPYYQVISFSEVMRVPCSQCGKEQPLIESYHQTHDSPEGDTWERKRLVICCGDIQIIKHKTSNTRF